ncbi:cation efflux protein [Massarina eburnea CBS 473.64]|uniref:Zinc transporter n=1 Tax=Massarina eburnea CBS 473.64 TaxID=1395130 RepID=A0A6A6RYG1_9PLEO|nr:cation efflux protein [Massarina eburnea CBS 473.64]
MASTYALPLNPATQTHGHGHRHSSEMSGQLQPQYPSPYRHTQAHSHAHSHSHSRSNDSTTYTLKPFMGGARPGGRPQGESDLGRPNPRKNMAANVFSPIQETPPTPLQVPSSSWLELPEALTALLIPLPFLFASLAYPSVVAQARRLPTSPLDITANSDPLSPPGTASGGQFLHACTLSSTTLLLIGIVAKVRSAIDEPLDRRKAEQSEKNAYNAMFSVGSLWRMFTNALSVLLPFYATMQLGGEKTALVLLAAATGGLGGFDQGPGKHSALENTRRTLRTRKWTWGSILLVSVADVFASVDAIGTLFGYLALATSIAAVPLPLPTAGWFLMTKPKSQDAWNSARASLPKPSSPLINTPRDTLLTLASGIVLTVVAVLYSSVVASSPSLSHFSVIFSTLSVASATALVYLSLPSSLRSQQKAGLVLGGGLAAASGVWEHSDTWKAWMFFPMTCALLFGAITFDTRSSATSRPSSHDHSHADPAHDHDHHLHGNHSKLSALLIAQCTPGSILHSILIEKDSRRIAYFGVLNLGFMMVQFFYGFVTGSLGLLTDSIHMLFDCAGLAVGLAAAVMSKWRPNIRFPYGYGKVDTLSGFANGVFLLLVSVEIIFDAFERLWEGVELNRLNELLIVSVLGFLVNIVGLTAFGHAHHGHGHSHDDDHGDHGHSHGHSHDNENMQGIFLHILADALGSVAVIISTLLTKYYGWSGWDPIASCIIAVLIFASAIPLVKSAGMRLMLSLPADVEYGLRNTLQELSSLRGVVAYSVPKFWLEDEGAAHAEVHAKEHEECDHGHDHDHGDHSHDHGHEHSHDHSHSHSHSEHIPGHSHDHSGHSHSHSHSHSHDHHDHHAPRQPRILGVIHIISSPMADLEDVRERATQFLKGRGMEVVVHVEKDGERCWCGGNTKAN